MRIGWRVIALLLVMTVAWIYALAAAQDPLVVGAGPATAPAAPQQPGLRDGTILSSVGPVTLNWQVAADAAQFHLQVVPSSGDGPGVNVIRSGAGRFLIPAPPEWYILLPDMTYSWRVRVSAATNTIAEDDPSWSSWSPKCSSRRAG